MQKYATKKTDQENDFVYYTTFKQYKSVCDYVLSDDSLYKTSTPSPEDTGV